MLKSNNPAVRRYDEMTWQGVDPFERFADGSYPFIASEQPFAAGRTCTVVGDNAGVTVLVYANMEDDWSGRAFDLRLPGNPLAVLALVETLLALPSLDFPFLASNGFREATHEDDLAVHAAVPRKPRKPRTPKPKTETQPSVYSSRRRGGCCGR